MMRKGTFWLIWGVGAGPMLLAMMLYFTSSGPGEGTQRGQLLPPGQTVAGWQLSDALGEPLQATGQWQLLLTSPSHCEARCAWWQQQLGQVHKALGKEQPRVQWQALSQQAGLGAVGEGVWIVDPHGNLVMRYSLQQAPQDLLRDLRRLLKVSRIG